MATSRRWRSEQVCAPRGRLMTSCRAVRLKANLMQQDLIQVLKSSATTQTTYTDSGTTAHAINSIPSVEEIAPHHTIRTNDTQIDGAERFPNIASVIGKGNTCDELRSIGETGFYEVVRPDGVVKRRSVMKSVAKDDCLLVRGANPRTGLITPDAVSVVGSLDTNVQLLRAQRPSPQWKMEDDQWISVEPHDKTAIPGGKSDHHKLGTHWHDQLRKASPLTESNLQSLSEQHGRNPSSTTSVTTAYPTSPLPVNAVAVQKVRRKPVTPSKDHASNKPLSTVERGGSTETVIRTPRHQNHRVEYFSPDDVGAITNHRLSAISSVDEGHQRPFLDQSVNHRNDARQHLGCFTDRLSKRQRLEQSLRTSSGPYPSRHLNPKQPHIDVGLMLPPMPNTSRPRNLSHQHVNGMSHSPPTARPLYLSRTPRPIVNHRIRDKTSHPLERHQVVHEDQGTLLNHFTTEHRSQSDTGQINQRPSGTADGQHPTRDGPSVPSQRPLGPRQIFSNAIHQSLGSGQWPRQGSHRLEPQLKHGSSPETTMVERTPSNLTGTATQAPSEDDDERKETDSNEDGLPHTLVSDDRVEATKHSTTTRDRPSATSSNSSCDIDHTVCCPECCVRFECHDSCLGHASPGSSTANSEASSLLSMGVFESSFETSVEAVNDVLMTPKHERVSKLAKLGNLFITESSVKLTLPGKKDHGQQSMKRTIRESSKFKKSQTPFISSPVSLSSQKGAVTAATKAMQVQRPKPIRTNAHTIADLRDRKFATSGKRSWVSGSETRHVSHKEDQEAWPASPAVKSLIDNDSMSFISRMSSVMRQPQIDLGNLSALSDLIPQVIPLLAQLKSMFEIVLDTCSVITGLVFEYKQRGTMTLPRGLSAAELLGNVVRSLLFVMIAACLYALFAKITRAMFVVLRIVLLPVRLCAWVIG